MFEEDGECMSRFTRSRIGRMGSIVGKHFLERFGLFFGQHMLGSVGWLWAF